MTPDDPRHGQPRGYSAGCRDACCRRAHARHMKLNRVSRAQGRPGSLPVLGTQRRIQALMALGWTTQDIADAGGWSHRSKVSQFLNGQKGRPARYVTRATAARVAAVYDRLSMTVPPLTPARARTRALAAERGYVPPLAWDDIDDPAELPTIGDDSDDVDPVVVERILAGDWRLSASPAERLEVVARWTGSLAALERLTGWNIGRDRREAVAA